MTGMAILSTGCDLCDNQHIFMERAVNLKMHYRYRPDIDGLRALAILPVILFHAGFGCSGGFVGVDVFLLFLVF